MICRLCRLKNVIKSGGTKTNEKCAPPKIFKLKILRRIWIYRILYSEVLKWFFTFKIDVHTPGTTKSKNMHILLIKKWWKNEFFHDLRSIFGSRNEKINMKTLLNILNQLVKWFNHNRPVSAEMRILANFSAKIFFPPNELIFQKNILLCIVYIIFRPHVEKIKIDVYRAVQSWIIAWISWEKMHQN